MHLYYLKNAEDMALKMSDALGYRLMPVDEREFPDGEVIVRTNVGAGPAVIVGRMYPNVNNNIVKLVLLLDVLSDYGVSKMALVLPYLPYARQDRRFRGGEPISVKALLKMLAHYNVSHLFTVDVHKEGIRDYISSLTLVNAFPVNEYADVAKRIGVDAVISPDVGSLGRAAAVAHRIGVRYDYFEKHRDRDTGTIHLKVKEMDVAGMHVALIDDIASTGGTLVDACKTLKSLGAREVTAIVTHCLMVGDAWERLMRCMDRIYCTNTIQNPHASIDITWTLVNSLRENYAAPM